MPDDQTTTRLMETRRSGESLDADRRRDTGGGVVSARSRPVRSHPVSARVDTGTEGPGEPVVDDSRGPGFLTRLVAIVLAVVIGLAGGAVALIWLFSRTVSQVNPFEQNTVDRSGPVVVQSLTDLKTYHAASGYYEIVIDQEKDVENLPSFLAGERWIFVAAGTVDATVDFAGLGRDSVATNGDRTAVSVALPAVRLGEPQLDLDRSYLAAHQRGMLQRIQDATGTQGGGQNTEELYRVAKQRLAQAGARTEDLKQRARDNTRAMLTSLFSQAGYRKVTVTFADE